MLLDLSTDFAIGAAICGGLSSLYLIMIRLSPPEKITNIKKVQEFGYPLAVQEVIKEMTTMMSNGLVMLKHPSFPLICV